MIDYPKHIREGHAQTNPDGRAMREFYDGKTTPLQEVKRPFLTKTEKRIAGLLLGVTIFAGGYAFRESREHPEPVKKQDGTERVEQETHEYSVKPGDTLWGIARSELGPDAEVRGYVDTLSEQLGKDGILKAGQTLVLRGPGDANAGSIDSNQNQP